jgi:hypothetical protein
MNCEVLLSHCSFPEVREFMKKHFTEIYEVKPGYKLFDSYLIGVPPIPIGVEGDNIIFPYTKPCHGTFVLKAEGKEEIARLRKQK